MQIFLKIEKGHNSMDINQQRVKNMLKAWVQMTELLTFVSAGILKRRHTKVCQSVLVCYADHIYHPPSLPLQ